jgi:hypothetical protein
MSYVVVLPNNSYKPFTNTAWVSAGLVNYKKNDCIREENVLQLSLVTHIKYFIHGINVNIIVQ